MRLVTRRVKIHRIVWHVRLTDVTRSIYRFAIVSTEAKALEKMMEFGLPGDQPALALLKEKHIGTSKFRAALYWRNPAGLAHTISATPFRIE